MDKIKVKKLSEGAVLPKRATLGSAGYDLCACIDAPVRIMPNEIKKINTGIAIEIPENNIVGLVYARSGISSKFGIAPVNCVGVIDSDYRGELIVPLINHSEKEYIINPLDRIAQLVFTPVFTPDVIEADELSDTARGCGGFGSTGKK